MPVPEALQHEIQSAYSDFLNARGMKPRLGQRQMIGHIARTLADLRDGKGPHVCVVEAGTGTGKTLAYTLAAVPLAQALDKSLVISTATVALQEQILYRDLPDVLKHTSLEFSISLAKGRGRYLCLSKLEQTLTDAGHGSMSLYPDEAAFAPDEQALKIYQSMADALVTSQWDGDRDNWREGIEDHDWLRVTNDHSRCTGRRCSHVRQCSFYRARERIEGADVIVANHDLVLADLALGGGAILPPPEDCIYVLDEAHNLPDKVLGHFSHRLRLGSTLRWLEQTSRGLIAIAAADGIDATIAGSINSLSAALQALQAETRERRALWEELLDDPAVEDYRFRFVNGIVDDERRAAARSLADLNADVVAQAQQIGEALNKLLERGGFDAPRESMEEWLGFFGGLALRCESALGLWRAYAADAATETPPRARWLQGVEQGGGDIDICCSPIVAAESLREQLWERCFAAVLTSATLTSLGTFDRFRMQQGLGDDATYLVVPSPFQFAEAAQLTVPPMHSDGGRATEHTAELIERLPEWIDPDEGTLMLFSSRRQMEDVYAGLPEQWRERILIQDRLSKQALLNTHRERIDAGQGSIIFGLASFAEGIDLPGDYCTHVLIAKIPFAVPNDPVEQSLAEWVEQNNGKPFMEISVPDAAQRLVQASGRLLRNERDRGRITILDRRIVTRRYGRDMLNSLPPYRLVLN